MMKISQIGILRILINPLLLVVLLLIVLLFNDISILHCSGIQSLESVPSAYYPAASLQHSSSMNTVASVPILVGIPLRFRFVQQEDSSAVDSTESYVEKILNSLEQDTDEVIVNRAFEIDSSSVSVTANPGAQLTTCAEVLTTASLCCPLHIYLINGQTITTSSTFYSIFLRAINALARYIRSPIILSGIQSSAAMLDACDGGIYQVCTPSYRRIPDSFDRSEIFNEIQSLLQSSNNVSSVSLEVPRERLSIDLECTLKGNLINEHLVSLLHLQNDKPNTEINVEDALSFCSNFAGQIFISLESSENDSIQVESITTILSNIVSWRTSHPQTSIYVCSVCFTDINLLAHAKSFNIGVEVPISSFMAPYLDIFPKLPPLSLTATSLSLSANTIDNNLTVASIAAWLSHACVLHITPSTAHPSLITTVVVDEHQVSLGLVYSSVESIHAAFIERIGIYYSRSRREIWRKGLTSGNTQRLVSVDLDCDGDALRFMVEQSGVGFCHLNRWSCFPNGHHEGLFGLMRTLEDRRDHPIPKSYTNRLLNDEGLLNNKVLEEINEFLTAPTKPNRASEAADVLYFMSVLLCKERITWKEVESYLDVRSLRVRRRPGNAKANSTNSTNSSNSSQINVNPTTFIDVSGNLKNIE